MRERDWNSSPRLRRRHSLEQMMKNAARGLPYTDSNDMQKSYSAQQAPPTPINTTNNRLRRKTTNTTKPRKRSQKTPKNTKTNKNGNGNGNSRSRLKTKSKKSGRAPYDESNNRPSHSKFSRNNNNPKPLKNKNKRKKKRIQNQNKIMMDHMSPPPTHATIQHFKHRPHTQSQPMIPFSLSRLAVASPISVSDIPSKTDAEPRDIVIQYTLHSPGSPTDDSSYHHNIISGDTRMYMDDSDHSTSSTPEIQLDHHYVALSKSNNDTLVRRGSSSPNSPNKNEPPIPLPIYGGAGSHSYHRDNDQHQTDSRSISHRNISDLVANAEPNIDHYLQTHSRSLQEDGSTSSRSQSQSSYTQPLSSKSAPTKIMLVNNGKNGNGNGNGKDMSAMDIVQFKSILRQEIETEFKSKFDELKQILLDKDQEHEQYNLKKLTEKIREIKENGTKKKESIKTIR